MVVMAKQITLLRGREAAMKPPTAGLEAALKPPTVAREGNAPWLDFSVSTSQNPSRKNVSRSKDSESLPSL